MGAKIYETAIPCIAQTPLSCALHGGEDLELLFTVPARLSRDLPRRISGVKLSRIGEIVPRRGRNKDILLVRDGKERALPIRGFQHF